MLVGTNIIGSTGFNVVGTSTVEIDAARVQFGTIAFAGYSSITVNARLKWINETDTAETWTQINDTSETWDPVSASSETWTAVGDSSETWTPVADNSESWHIAA